MTGVPIGQAETVLKGGSVAILAFGSMVHSCIDMAAKMDATLINMRFIKPIDSKTIRQMSETHDLLVTLEENAIAGGAGSAVNETLASLGITIPILNIGIPDQFIEHGSRDDCLTAAGLDPESVTKQIMQRLESLGLGSPNRPNLVQGNS
jgi:1-deoxy-D-xylulose-5-phosphate synthase